MLRIGHWHYIHNAILLGSLTCLGFTLNMQDHIQTTPLGNVLTHTNTYKHMQNLMLVSILQTNAETGKQNVSLEPNIYTLFIPDGH